MNEFAPQLAALKRCVDNGFNFQAVPAGIYGFRSRAGAIDVLLVRSYDDSLSARYRVGDLEHVGAQALWSAEGEVAEVVRALLALPVHGERGAPSRATCSVDLWLPDL